MPISKRRDGEERRWMEMRHASSSSMEEQPRLAFCCYETTWVTLMCSSFRGEAVWSSLLLLDLGGVSPACLQTS